MNVLVIDGHPDSGRLISELLDIYVKALPEGTKIERIAVRDLEFDLVLRNGYKSTQAIEPDLGRVAQAIAGCDHLVVAFPLWWGAEPAALKGLLDRVLLPGFAFKFKRESAFWDKLLTGRSADVLVTMDTPPWFLRLVYGDPLMKRWRKQVLGFCGFSPVRGFMLGGTKKGAAAKNLAGWTSRLTKAAASADTLKRGPRHESKLSLAAFEAAMVDREV